MNRLSVRFESVMTRQGWLREVLIWFCFAVIETALWGIVFAETQGKILTYQYYTAEDGHLYYASALKDFSVQMLPVLGGFLVFQLVLILWSYRHKFNWGRILLPVFTLMNFGLLLQFVCGSGFTTQFLHYCLGFVVMLVFCVVSCVEPGRNGVIFVAVLMILLCVSNVLFGTVINGSRAWIILPVVHLSFQPGEFLKVIDIILVSLGYERLRNDIKARTALVISFLTQIAVLFWVNDTGNALVLILLAVSCMLAFNIVDTIFSILSVGIIAAFSAGVISLFSNKVMTKLTGIFNQHFSIINTVLMNRDQDAEQNFRTLLLGVVRAGLKGTGLMNGEYTFQTNTLAANSDYAVLTIAGVFGISAVAVIILALVVLVRNADSSQDALSSSQYISGKLCTIVLVLHALIHTAAACNIGPMTGCTFPWVSAGGSAIIADGMLIGILLGNCLPRQRRIMWAKRFHHVMNPIVDAAADSADLVNQNVRTTTKKAADSFIEAMKVPYTEEEMYEQLNTTTDVVRKENEDEKEIE